MWIAWFTTTADAKQWTRNGQSYLCFSFFLKKKGILLQYVKQNEAVQLRPKYGLWWQHNTFWNPLPGIFWTKALSTFYTHLSNNSNFSGNKIPKKMQILIFEYFEEWYFKNCFRKGKCLQVTINSWIVNDFATVRISKRRT